MGKVCIRKGCSTVIAGRAQVCADCAAKDLICQAPGCGKPHEGVPRMTRFCPPCRSLRRRKPRSARNPAWTEAEDQLLRDTYAKYPSARIGARLQALFPTRPRWSLTRRAQELGAATVRTREAPWSPEELAIMAKFYWMVPERLAMKLRDAGFHRTVTAVSVRRKRLTHREQIDGYTARGLASILDVDDHAVTRWIKLGWLQAERRGTTGDNHDSYMIRTEGVRALLFAHPELFDLAKIERGGQKSWFLELVTSGRIGPGGGAVVETSAGAPAPPGRTFQLYGERVTLAALAEISGRPEADVLHRIDGLGMSTEGAAFGKGEAVAWPPSAPTAQAAEGLLSLMKQHRARPIDVAGWIGAPVGLVERMLGGAVVMVAPALVQAVEKLDGTIIVSITTKQRGRAP